jgi:hypothetical protein
MADEIIRETIGVKLVRLEEKLDALCVQNDASHQQLLNGQAYISNKMEVEDAKMDNRIKELEVRSPPLHNLVEKLTDVVDKLTDTVAGLSRRTESLEVTRTKTEAERRGELKVYKAVVAILGIAVSVTTIMWLVGVFLHFY